MISKINSSLSFDKKNNSRQSQKPSFGGIVRLTCLDSNQSFNFLQKCDHFCKTINYEGIPLKKSTGTVKNNVAEFFMECENFFDEKLQSRAKKFADNNGWSMGIMKSAE